MIDAYLGRLGLARQAPSVDYLLALQRAHVSRVVYGNLQIMRGVPAGIEPESAVREIIEGRGGYCFHLNSGFAWLLRELGFAVSLHRGYVTTDEPSDLLNHLVLVVHDLDGMWFVDAGLGDAIYEPVRLTSGPFVQGPFAYRLDPAVHRDGWRFTHHELGSFRTMEFESAASTLEAFAGAHRRLSASPESSFKRVLTVQARFADRVDIVRGCVFTVVSGAGKHETMLDTRSAWIDALAGFGLPASVEALWPTTRAGHREWLASR